MPKVEVKIYKEEDGTAPFLDWLLAQEAKVQDKCTEQIEHLGMLGIEALTGRRVIAKLRDGIYEIRFKHFRVNHRVLFFWDSLKVVMLSHGLEKEAGVPEKDIELALVRKTKYFENRSLHTYREEEENGE